MKTRGVWDSKCGRVLGHLVSMALILLCGCRQWDKTLCERTNRTKVELAITNVQLDQNGLPKLTVKVTNCSGHTVEYRHLSGDFWGKVVLACTDQRVELRHRKMYWFITTVLGVPNAIVLKPGQSFTQALDLSSDFITKDEFVYGGSQSENGRSKGAEVRRWRKEISECSKLRIVCVSDWPKLQSDAVVLRRSGDRWMPE